MDTERMKRVLERVYGPAAPAEEKKTPDALRESIRLEAEAAAWLRYLMRTSRACQNAFGEALRRCETRRRALHTEFFLREGERAPQLRSGTAPGVLSALRQIVLLAARGCGSMRARRKTPCRSRRKRRAALPRSAVPRRAPRRVCSRSR